MCWSSLQKPMLYASKYATSSKRIKNFLTFLKILFFLILNLNYRIVSGSTRPFIFIDIYCALFFTFLFFLSFWIFLPRYYLDFENIPSGHPLSVQRCLHSSNFESHLADLMLTFQTVKLPNWSSWCYLCQLMNKNLSWGICQNFGASQNVQWGTKSTD